MFYIILYLISLTKYLSKLFYYIFNQSIIFLFSNICKLFFTITIVTSRIIFQQYYFNNNTSTIPPRVFIQVAFIYLQKRNPARAKNSSQDRRNLKNKLRPISLNFYLLSYPRKGERSTFFQIQKFQNSGRLYKSPSHVNIPCFSPLHGTKLRNCIHRGNLIHYLPKTFRQRINQV